MPRAAARVQPPGPRDVGWLSVAACITGQRLRSGSAARVSGGPDPEGSATRVHHVVRPKQQLLSEGRAIA